MFSLVEQRSIPGEAGPTGEMRAKHEQRRNFVKAEKCSMLHAASCSVHSKRKLLEKLRKSKRNYRRRKTPRAHTSGRGAGKQLKISYE